MRKIFMIISAVLCNLLGCTAQQEKFESLDVDAFEKVISDTTVVRYNHENQVFGPQKTRRRNLK